MLPGPVFNVELLTTARQARYYAARVLYGLVLLLVIWESYEGSVRNRETVTIGEMSRFATALFGSFALAQSGAILLLTPILVAGVIADEKQRKTLHYLLASRLTSAEIVLGKLAARTLHILVYLLMGLPIIALLGLLGGIDPIYVAILDTGCLITAFFLGSLSILISTYANKVRDAIIGTYLIGIAWLAVPPIIDSLVRYDPNLKWLQPFVLPINDWLVAINPIGILINLERPGTSFSIWIPMAWYCGLQAGLGAFMLLFATWRLRPVFASSNKERGARSWSMRWQVRRARRRRAVGDDPMLWKERFVGKPGGFLRNVVRVVGFFAILGVAYGAVAYGVPAYRELMEEGYHGNGMGWSSRIEQFGRFSQIITTLVFVAWGIGVATTAASGITSEKEEDTWTSLTVSDLTGVDILSAKMIGSVWRLRGLLYLMFALWLLNLPTGALHSFGFLAGTATLAIYTWYCVALGTYLSMRSRTTTRAIALTVVALLITNVGYLLCCIPFRPNSSMIFVGCMPATFVVSQFSTTDVWTMLRFEGPAWNSGPRQSEMRAALVIGAFLYGIAAQALTHRSFSGFDRLLDRPRRVIPKLPRLKRSSTLDV